MHHLAMIGCARRAEKKLRQIITRVEGERLPITWSLYCGIPLRGVKVVMMMTHYRAAPELCRARFSRHSRRR